MKVVDGSRPSLLKVAKQIKNNATWQSQNNFNLLTGIVVWVLEILSLDLTRKYFCEVTIQFL